VNPDALIDGPSDGAASLDPIRVFGGTQDPSVIYHDLRILGSGLEQYEGTVVTFRIGDPISIFRLGSGQTRIVQGGFDVLFSGILNPNRKRMLIHIDADGSHACEPGEPVYLDFPLYSMDATLTVAPNVWVGLRAASAGDCDNIRTFPSQ
jgi:hypothetical protein